MRTIWKFELGLVDAQRIEMPEGAQIVHVAGQHDRPTLWAEVDDAAELVERLFAVIGTGHPAPTPDQATYVGSAICGPFVWHVYDGGEH